MLAVRFMTTSGKFDVEHEQTFEKLSDAVEACKARYGARGFTRFVVQEDGDGWRITARTPGGRSGRNVAFVDDTY